jgi:hypothetical protein
VFANLCQALREDFLKMASCYVEDMLVRQLVLPGPLSRPEVFLVASTAFRGCSLPWAGSWQQNP